MLKRTINIFLILIVAASCAATFTSRDRSCKTNLKQFSKIIKANWVYHADSNYYEVKSILRQAGSNRFIFDIEPYKTCLQGITKQQIIELLGTPNRVINDKMNAIEYSNQQYPDPIFPYPPRIRFYFTDKNYFIGTADVNDIPPFTFGKGNYNCKAILDHKLQTRILKEIKKSIKQNWLYHADSNYYEIKPAIINNGTKPCIPFNYEPYKSCLQNFTKSQLLKLLNKPYKQTDSTVEYKTKITCAESHFATVRFSFNKANIFIKAEDLTPTEKGIQIDGTRGDPGCRILIDGKPRSNPSYPAAFGNIPISQISIQLDSIIKLNWIYHTDGNIVEIKKGLRDSNNQLIFNNEKYVMLLRTNLNKNELIKTFGTPYQQAANIIDYKIQHSLSSNTNQSVIRFYFNKFGFFAKAEELINPIDIKEAAKQQY